MRFIPYLLFLWFGFMGCVTAQPTTQIESTAFQEAEKNVQALVKTDGIHVIKFWAPWCHNSVNELRNSMYEVLEAYEDTEVTFTFVTIRNDGKSGRTKLDQYLIPASANEILVPDTGDRNNRFAFPFMNMTVGWTPTTWVFHKNGTLAYAFNYGEVSNEMLTEVLENLKKNWMD